MFYSNTCKSATFRSFLLLILLFIGVSLTHAWWTECAINISWNLLQHWGIDLTFKSQAPQSKIKRLFFLSLEPLRLIWQLHLKLRASQLPELSWFLWRWWTFWMLTLVLSLSLIFVCLLLLLLLNSSLRSSTCCLTVLAAVLTAFISPLIPSSLHAWNVHPLTRIASVLCCNRDQKTR